MQLGLRVCAGAVLLLTCRGWAGEGKWTPQQVLELGPAWVRAQGFKVPTSKLWSPKEGAGLLTNAVQLPGCSGSFVSKEGLLITNHHCVLSILQEHSTPQKNLVRDGYSAKSRGDELASRSFRIQVPRAFRDVTAEVLDAIPTGVTDAERFLAVERAQKQLVASCEQQPRTRCVFAIFEGGLSFGLTSFTELSDLRVVYAPPEAIGNFGGDVDNWSWPRHTGDFALLRAYLDGAPFRPQHWFPVSSGGIRPGEAVAVLGYPGTSYRGLIADEVREREEFFFPRTAELADEAVRIMEEEGRRSPAVEVSVADDLRSQLNRRKNAQGQLAGLRRGRVVEQRRLLEARVKAWATKRRDPRQALSAFVELEQLGRARLETWERDFLLDTVLPRALAWPLTLARRSTESVKTDVEREPGYMERDLPRLAERLERDQKRYAVSVDARLFAAWVQRAMALPANQRIAAVDRVFAPFSTPAQRSAKIAELVKASKVFELAARKEMFNETPRQLSERKDPLLDLGLAVDLERRILKERRDAWAGAGYRLRPSWRRAVLDEARRPLAPDANGSLRVTFCRVRGYKPRDAVTLDPRTTLKGLLEKHTGVAPFAIPEAVRTVAESGQLGRWRDAALGDLPINFLSDCDTTGGNSGSPTIDGMGRLVGVNFDRVWENVANDFGYDPSVARNVNADVRYLLWLLDQATGTKELLAELLGAPP